MATQGRETDGATRKLIMWLRDRGFSVAECARRSNVSRPTARKIIVEELRARGQNVSESENEET